MPSDDTFIMHSVMPGSQRKRREAGWRMKIFRGRSSTHCWRTVRCPHRRTTPEIDDSAAPGARVRPLVADLRFDFGDLVFFHGSLQASFMYFRRIPRRSDVLAAARRTTECRAHGGGRARDAAPASLSSVTWMNDHPLPPSNTGAVRASAASPPGSFRETSTLRGSAVQHEPHGRDGWRVAGRTYGAIGWAWWASRTWRIPCRRHASGVKHGKKKGHVHPLAARRCASRDDHASRRHYRHFHRARWRHAERGRRLDLRGGSAALSAPTAAGQHFVRGCSLIDLCQPAHSPNKATARWRHLFEPDD